MLVRLSVIGPAVRADFRRLYPANAKTPTCCPSDDNRTKVTNSVTSARSLWWHVGPYFWPADLTRTANPIMYVSLRAMTEIRSKMSHVARLHSASQQMLHNVPCGFMGAGVKTVLLWCWVNQGGAFFNLLGWTNFTFHCHGVGWPKDTSTPTWLYTFTVEIVHRDEQQKEEASWNTRPKITSCSIINYQKKNASITSLSYQMLMLYVLCKNT